MLATQQAFLHQLQAIIIATCKGQGRTAAQICEQKMDAVVTTKVFLVRLGGKWWTDVRMPWFIHSLTTNYAAE